jgi:hypothetical protein
MPLRGLTVPEDHTSDSSSPPARIPSSVLKRWCFAQVVRKESLPNGVDSLVVQQTIIRLALCPIRVPIEIIRLQTAPRNRHHIE